MEKPRESARFGGVVEKKRQKFDDFSQGPGASSDYFSSRQEADEKTEAIRVSATSSVLVKAAAAMRHNAPGSVPMLEHAGPPRPGSILERIPCK